MALPGDEDPVHGRTGLARGLELAGHQIAQGEVEVRILADHEGAIPTELENDLLALVRCRGGQPATGRGRSGEADDTDSVIGDQGFDDSVVLGSDQLNEVVRSRLAKGFHEGRGAQDAESGQLDQHRRAGSQGRSDLAGQACEGVVQGSFFVRPAASVR